jgi:pimeloyl-ACP methyl ester carboxylesterase
MPTPEQGCIVAPREHAKRIDANSWRLEMSATVAHRNVRIDDIDIFYREAGPQDGPVLLLLHGFPSSSHMFRNLIPVLADKYHVVAPDFPGYGQSSAPSIDKFRYTFGNLTDVIERYGPAWAFILCHVPIGYRLVGRLPPRCEAS